MTKPITKIAIEAGDQDVIAAYLRRLAEEFERNRRLGDLRRAFVSLPARYARRALRRSQPRDRFLGLEFRGYLSGLAFYLTGSRRA